ncbi:MAG TPA: hypothetical protein VIZ68_03640 [Thermoplasmata archaeon]
MSPSLSDWPGPDYEVRVSIRAPMAFVHRWCTDYSPDDPKIEGEKYVRRVLKRTARRVVYEDLWESKKGWFWTRYTVDLKPPSSWHMESQGNSSHLIGDYSLNPGPNETTEFHLRYRRKASILPFQKVAVRRRRVEDTRAWHRFARALEADYRRSLRSAG